MMTDYMGCNGLVDELRISKGARNIGEAPSEPWACGILTKSKTTNSPKSPSAISRSTWRQAPSTIGTARVSTLGTPRWIRPPPRSNWSRWPNGIGEPNLYRVELAFTPDVGGVPVRKSFQTGLRTVEMGPLRPVFVAGPRPAYPDSSRVGIRYARDRRVLRPLRQIRDHDRLGRRLIKEDEPQRFEASLDLAPDEAGSGDIRTGLFRRAESLFLYVSPMSAKT